MAWLFMKAKQKDKDGPMQKWDHNKCFCSPASISHSVTTVSEVLDYVFTLFFIPTYVQ